MKPFTVSYPSGASFHVSKTKRDQMLQCGEIEHIEGANYRFMSATRSLAGLAAIHFSHGPSSMNVEGSESAAAPRERGVGHFLPGSFVVELQGERHHEAMETPEALAARLNLGGKRAEVSSN